MEEPILKVEGLTHVYSQGTPFQTTAIKNVSFELYKGQVAAVIGHTGSGKSTLIQHLNALIKPTEGRVLFKGRDINASKENMKAVRADVGLVFQYPEYQLFEETVYRDIAFGPKNQGLSEKEIDERVHRAAGFVGIEQRYLQVSPFELSGGQKRRAAIAGVIAMMPEVLILDEPMAGLDPAGREGIMANLMSYHEATGAALLIVTHSMDDAARYASRMIVMDHGTVALDGPTAEVFSHGEELTKMGLAVPTASLIADRLRQLGVPLEGSIYTLDLLEKEILRLRGGRENA
ncbi:MAG: energy-coupling factor transporter ATPase [Oscillospiraceae bacterium]|nr:energy-coupling factor transporter ATPase [Oscillospiraceae bacterium]